MTTPSSPEWISILAKHFGKARIKPTAGAANGDNLAQLLSFQNIPGSAATEVARHTFIAQVITAMLSLVSKKTENADAIIKMGRTLATWHAYQANPQGEVPERVNPVQLQVLYNGAMSYVNSCEHRRPRKAHKHESGASSSAELSRAKSIKAVLRALIWTAQYNDANPAIMQVFAISAERAHAAYELAVTYESRRNVMSESRVKAEAKETFRKYAVSLLADLLPQPAASIAA